jgi:hypothetical protein
VGRAGTLSLEMNLFKVHHRLISNPLPDPASEVRARLDALGIDIPAGEVALTAGSRGIAHIPSIMRAAGEWVRARGARPFVVPCMGSHNGATAAGQRAMIESLGMTEAAMGMEIRTGMDVVRVGETDKGAVYMDRRCFESAGVLVINRVKLHTCFSGPVQSGLVKMMVVGMGKLESAETFHRAPTPVMGEMILRMGKMILDSGKILAALAILEDGFDETAEVHALRPEEILATEPRLLERHRRYFPRLPLDDINVLIVDSIGKTYSGTGMDTNVIGYRGIRGYEDLEKPRIHVIAALSLAEASQGNAIGVGLADFITRRLRDAIDEEKTLINVLTTGDMGRMRIPATFPDDESLVDCLERRFGSHRWVFISDTFRLDQFYVTEDLASELESHPLCEVEARSHLLSFEKGRHTLRFASRERPSAQTG